MTRFRSNLNYITYKQTNNGEICKTNNQKLHFMTLNIFFIVIFRFFSNFFSDVFLIEKTRTSISKPSTSSLTLFSLAKVSIKFTNYQQIHNIFKYFQFLPIVRINIIQDSLYPGISVRTIISISKVKDFLRFIISETVLDLQQCLFACQIVFTVRLIESSVRLSR